jgi:gluconolactonase
MNMSKSAAAVAALLATSALNYGLVLRPVSAQAPAVAPAVPSVERLDPGLDDLVAPDAAIEKAASGIKFAEGPTWRRNENALWFSDLIGNILYQLGPDGKLTEILNPAGYDGHDLPAGSYMGSNGMTPGPDGTLTLCQHGNRRIVSVGPDKKVTMLVDNYEGKRLNSPNDVVYAKDGSLYFTDPPFGLVGRDNDPQKDLKFNGVFRFYKGKLQLLISDIATPNGIAFSPDFKTLYVTDAAGPKRRWMKYDVQPDGTVANPRVFADASAFKESGTTDGMKVDQAGNVYATGPGGVWIMTPDGKHLGTIKLPETPSSVAFGGADFKTMYITARTSVYKVQVKVAGEKPVYY